MPSRSEQSAGVPLQRWTAEGGGGWERERGRGGVCEWAGGMLVYSIDDLALYLFLHVTDTNGIMARREAARTQAGQHLVVYVTCPHGPRSVPWLTRARNAGFAFDAARAKGRHCGAVRSSHNRICADCMRHMMIRFDHSVPTEHERSPMPASCTATPGRHPRSHPRRASPRALRSARALASRACRRTPAHEPAECIRD